MRTAASRALVVTAFAALAFLYYYRLGDAPIYLAHDEAMFGVVSHDVAWRVRDVDGRRLPLFVPTSGASWTMPAHVYLTALFVRVLGTTETAIRASSVSAALAAIWLLYLFGRRVFRHRGFAMLLAGLLALSPGFFIDSRISTDHHYPVIAIGLWLMCLARFFGDPTRDLWLGLAGLSLGAGLYTYGTSVLLMPIYAGLTALLLMKTDVRRVSAYAALGMAFMIWVIPIAIFVAGHPAYVAGVANAYTIGDAWTSLGVRADVYFSYFNPTLLFFSGGGLVQSTRMAGFFLAPFLILLPAAIVHVLRREVDWFAWLALVAFFATPLAASVVDERGAVQRVMALAPFGAILVTYFVTRVQAGRRAWLRIGTWVLLAAGLIAFARFDADYLGDYRRRSSFSFEQNIRGALEMAIDQTREAGGTSTVCLSHGINPFVDWYWKFYLRKHGAESLAAHTTYFDNAGDARNKCAPGVIVVSEIAICDQIAATRAIAPKRITEPGGAPSFCVF